MKIYAYFLRTESMDEILIVSKTNYKNAIDFMKNEVEWEYECWDGYEDNSIPYASFIKREYDTETL